MVNTAGTQIGQYGVIFEDDRWLLFFWDSGDEIYEYDTEAEAVAAARKEDQIDQAKMVRK